MPWFGLLLGGDYQICVVLEFLVQFNLVKLVISFYFDIFLTIFKRIQAYWVSCLWGVSSFEKRVIIFDYCSIRKMLFTCSRVILPSCECNYYVNQTKLCIVFIFHELRIVRLIWFEKKGFCAIFFELLSECH